MLRPKHVRIRPHHFTPPLPLLIFYRLGGTYPAAKQDPGKLRGGASWVHEGLLKLEPLKSCPIFSAGWTGMGMAIETEHRHSNIKSTTLQSK